MNATTNDNAPAILACTVSISTGTETVSRELVFDVYTPGATPADVIYQILDDALSGLRSPRQVEQDAARYRWLRERDLDTISQGGVFAGLTPDNVVLNGEDLDRAVDIAAALSAQMSTPEGKPH